MIENEYTNNHKVTCSECLHVEMHYRWVDELPFRCDETCKLGYETDYRVPFNLEWNCPYFETYTMYKSLKQKIKELYNQLRRNK